MPVMDLPGLPFAVSTFLLEFTCIGWFLWMLHFLFRVLENSLLNESIAEPN